MSFLRPARQRLGEFYGWWILSIAAAINGYGAGVNFYGFSVFFNPMREEFGWSSAATAGVFSLSRLEGGLEGPVTGWLIGKFGPKRVMVAGLTICGLGFMSMYFVQSLLMFYLVYGLLIATGFGMGFFLAPQSITANWFLRKRGRALAYLAIGAGLGGATLVPAMGAFIGLAGWRWTAFAVGALMWVVAIPLTLILRNQPEDVGQVPDGPPARTAPKAEDDSKVDGQGAEEEAQPDEFEEPEFTVGQVLRTSSFWTLLLAMAFRSCILSSIVVHQINHLEDIGVARRAAESALGFMILMSIPGRMLFGWLGDRYSKQYLLAASSVLQGIGIFILARATGLAYVWPFLLIYGLGYGGAIPLTQALRADLFGRKAFPIVSGIVMPATTVGAVIGPVFAGYVFDVTDSYRIAFYSFVVLILLSGLTFLFVKTPKPPVVESARAG